MWLLGCILPVFCTIKCVEQSKKMHLSCYPPGILHLFFLHVDLEYSLIFLDNANWFRFSPVDLILEDIWLLFVCDCNLYNQYTYFQEPNNESLCLSFFRGQHCLVPCFASVPFVSEVWMYFYCSSLLVSCLSLPHRYNGVPPARQSPAPQKKVL